MKFLIKKLTIKTKTRGDKIETFSPNITYYHGPSNVGKSTVANLIDFCLGKRQMPETEIISNYRIYMT